MTRHRRFREDSSNSCSDQHAGELSVEFPIPACLVTEVYLPGMMIFQEFEVPTLDCSVTYLKLHVSGRLCGLWRGNIAGG